MAHTTQANVLAIAPELSQMPREVWDLILSDVAVQITAGAWGARQEQAQRYLAAHKLAVLNRDTRDRAVTAERTGDVSTNYAAASGDNLDETAYGREFKRLQRSTIAGFMVVTP